MWHPLVRVFVLPAFYSSHFLKFSLSIKKNVYIYRFVCCWLSWIFAVSSLSRGVVSGGATPGLCVRASRGSGVWSTRLVVERRL